MVCYTTFEGDAHQNWIIDHPNFGLVVISLAHVSLEENFDPMIEPRVSFREHIAKSNDAILFPETITRCGEHACNKVDAWIIIVRRSKVRIYLIDKHSFLIPM